MSAATPASADALTQTDRAYQALRSAIVRCELDPGARLRVEELSQMLGVSSSPLREALSRLAGQGLVTSVENRGFRVAPLTLEGLTDLTRVRLIVEREALREAMDNGDDAWEARLVAAAHSLGLVEQRMGPGPLALDEDWSARHREFHLATYAGARSPLLQAMVADLFDAAERYRRYSARHRNAPRHKHAEHQDLLAAVLARRRKEALALLAQHISSTEQNVAGALLSMSGTTPH